MAWGAAATGTPRRHRLDRAGAVADAGVARRDHAGPAPARRAQHGAGRRATTARPPAAAATATTARSVLAPMDVPEAVELTQLRVPPRRHVAQPGDGLRRLLPRAHVRSRSTSQPIDFGAAAGQATGRSTAPPAAPVGPSWSRRSATPSSATTSATTSPSYYLRVRGDDRGRCSRASSRWSRPATSTTPRSSSSRSARRASTCAPRCAACGPTGARVGYVRPITLFPFPTEAIVGRAPSGARRRRGLREQPGPDGRRRAPRRARARARCEFIGGLSLDSSGFGIAPDSTSARLRRKITQSWRHRHDGTIEGRPVIPTDAPPTEPRAARRRLHARAHRRRRAPPVPRLRRADRDALGARGDRRARR